MIKFSSLIWYHFIFRAFIFAEIAEYLTDVNVRAYTIVQRFQNERSASVPLKNMINSERKEKKGKIVGHEENAEEERRKRCYEEN